MDPFVTFVTFVTCSRGFNPTPWLALNNPPDGPFGGFWGQKSKVAIAWARFAQRAKYIRRAFFQTPVQLSISSSLREESHFYGFQPGSWGGLPMVANPSRPALTLGRLQNFTQHPSLLGCMSLPTQQHRWPLAGPGPGRHQARDNRHGPRGGAG